MGFRLGWRRFLTAAITPNREEGVSSSLEAHCLRGDWSEREVRVRVGGGVSRLRLVQSERGVSTRLEAIFLGSDWSKQRERGFDLVAGGIISGASGPSIEGFRFGWKRFFSEAIGPCRKRFRLG